MNDSFYTKIFKSKTVSKINLNCMNTDENQRKENRFSFINIFQNKEYQYININISK